MPAKKPLNAVIYTIENCPWCVKAKKLLKLKDVPFVEIPEKSDKWPTAPYIEINDESIGGFVELTQFFRYSDPR